MDALSEAIDASQPRKHSFAESIANILVGLIINITAQAIVFPWFGVVVPLSSNLKIAGIFTVISIARSYGLRRLFNTIHLKILEHKHEALRDWKHARLGR